MRNLLATLCLLICSFFSAPSIGDESAGLTMVKNGVAVYVKDGASEAIKAWIAGSGLEGDTQALSQANVLKQVEDYYGKPEGMDLISEHAITDRSSIILIAINYNKGILYGEFYTYKTKDKGWILVQFKFNTKAVEILPGSVIYAE